MKINKDLLVPYCLATGFFNLIFTTVLILVASLIFSFQLTWEVFEESFAIGYIILWVSNLDIIKEK